MADIYTRRGDDGKTKLANGESTPKHSWRTDALGALDELEAFLGVVLASPATGDREDEVDIDEKIQRIQNELLSVASEIGLGTPPTPIDEDNVKELENEIDEANKSLPPLNQFVLRGGGKRGAFLHLACSVCRRAERAISALKFKTARHYVRDEVLQYINRLGDWLFIMARFENKRAGTPEPTWEQ
jgi:cob(I)alamin adenosyltransferase